MKDGAGAGGSARAPRTPFTLAILALLALGLFVGLVALGIWQLDRREWKHDLIERIESRVHADPVAAPGPPAWAGISAESDGYRKVRAAGRFLHDRETLVQAVTAKGSGYWVMTPLATDAGYSLLINRGFVPAELRDPARRAAGQVAGPVQVTGLMRMTEPEGGFLRSNDPAADRWFSRDIAAIAQAREIRPVAPYFIDADASPNPGGYPVGGLTVIQFPDNHLSYALTWFALAALVAGAAFIVGRHEWRLRRP